MKVIQTRYNGYHFRSRLEARWAVFFDSVGIKWKYENEGYELSNGMRYLPDFEIYKGNCLVAYVEVKGKEPTHEDKSKAVYLSEDSQLPVYIVNSFPYMDCGFFYFDIFVALGLSIDDWGMYGGSAEHGRISLREFISSLGMPSKTDYEVYESDCAYYLKKRAQQHPSHFKVGCCEHEVELFPYFLKQIPIPRVLRATDDAISARFEFGGK